MNPALIAALLRYGVPAGMGLAKGIETYSQTGDLGKAATSGLFTGGATFGLGALGEAAAPRLAGMIFGRAPAANAAVTSLAGYSPSVAAAGSGTRAIENATKVLGTTLPGIFQTAGSPLASGLGNIASNFTPGILGPRSGRQGGGDGGGGGVGQTAKDTAGAVLGTFGQNDGGMTQPNLGAGTGLNPSDYLQGAWDLRNPIGAMQNTLALVNQMDRQRMNMANQYQNYMLQAGDTMKQRDLQRGAAAAALKTQLGTQQGLILNGQQQGAALAQQAIGDTGALARTTFNYF